MRTRRSRLNLSVALLTLLSVAIVACDENSASESDDDQPVVDQDREPVVDEPTYYDENNDETDDADSRADERNRMVTRQIEGRGIDDGDVLEAMGAVPRHRYVPEQFRSRAYRDSPLPIGYDQTISQPFIVALMTELLEVSDDDRVLEIGTGSGYQAAVLAELGVQLYTIEIVCELAERADRDLDETGYGDVEVKCGDGYQGWPEHAPFDRIIVTAAPPEIPEALVDQLAVGGRMVVPVGDDRQQLQVIEKTDDGDIERSVEMGVRFVPMVPAEEK